MVSIRQSHLAIVTEIGSKQWLESLQLATEIEQTIEQTIHWCYEEAGFENNEVIKGCDMVEILADLNMDIDALIAALIFPLVDKETISIQQVEDRYGHNISRLISGILQMDAIRFIPLNGKVSSTENQVDKLRRLLVTMVDDVRTVVIKLAERICHLRKVKMDDEEVRVLAAKETASVYAPLATRLGIGQLKWELEDLAFRYLHPQPYKNIAEQLADKWNTRQQYLNDFISLLTKQCLSAGVKANVEGRAKHIYSIWKKMQKKNYGFDDLYDIRAVRVMTSSIQDCYTILGIIHTNWHHLSREFTDYIANPKANGYKSIHTIVEGPEHKTIEIQIRTGQMHEDAEMGVAAHWKYKEGKLVGKNSSYDEKISWLRRILQWQEDVVSNDELVEELRNQVVEDRVYAFTPNGDLVDLPKGSTPLDFAYYIHSNIGHRCIGAKVFNRIVPFSYEINTGDQIEILTGKHPAPSRDWLDPNQKYIRSSRARSKIVTWFKKQDKGKNLQLGKELLEKELQNLSLEIGHSQQLVRRFNLQNMDDLYAAIGGGDVKLNQVINYIYSQQLKQNPPELDPRLKQKITTSKAKGNLVQIDGVGNLMNHLAKCCQPVPGEAIIGYITKGKGIAVHTENCSQFLNLQQSAPERVVEVCWVENFTGSYQLTVKILAGDREGLLRDITGVLANNKVNLLSINSNTDKYKQSVSLVMVVELFSQDSLKLLQQIQRIEDVVEAKRLTQ